MNLLEHWEEMHPAYQSSYITALVMGYKPSHRPKVRTQAIDPLSAQILARQWGQGGRVRHAKELPDWLRQDLASKLIN